MNRVENAALLAVSGIACLLAAILYWLGYMGQVPAAAIVVLAYPVFVLALMYWWMAGRKEGDIPFMGY